jgi:hypothetical protein
MFFYEDINVSASMQKGQRKLTRPLSGVNGELCEKVCKKKRKKVSTESALLEMAGFALTLEDYSGRHKESDNTYRDAANLSN